MEDEDYKKETQSSIAPFVFQFKKEIEGTLEDLEKALTTGRPETLPPPVD